MPAITAKQSGHSVCPGGEMHWQDHIFCSSDWQTATLTKDEVKNGLVHLAYLFAHDLDKGKIKGFDKFCKHYNQRTLDINLAVYGAVAHISRITLLRWENTCETRYTKIDDTSPAQLQKLTEELIMVNPEITVEHLLMHFKTFFPKLTTPTKQQLNQWLKSIRGK